MDAISRLLAKNSLKSSVLRPKSRVEAQVAAKAQVKQSSGNEQAQKHSEPFPLDNLKALLRAEFHDTNWAQAIPGDEQQHIIKRAVRVMLKADLQWFEHVDSAQFEACIDDVCYSLASDPELYTALLDQLSEL